MPRGDGVDFVDDGFGSRRAEFSIGNLISILGSDGFLLGVFLEVPHQLDPRFFQLVIG